MRKILGAVVLVLTLPASVPAQQAASPPRGAPPPVTVVQPPRQAPLTFKVEVNYVEIDAVVTDERGNVVGDLTRDDFQILEQGRPQQVATFSLVDIPVEKSDPLLFKNQPIEADVRTNRRAFDGRPGLAVRARKGYVAQKGKAAPAAPVDTTASTELRDALASPIAISGLALDVFAAPLSGDGRNASVLLSIEVDGRRLTWTVDDQGARANNIELAVVAVDDSAKVRDGGRDVVELRLRPESVALVARTGVRITRRLQVPPGRYQLRIGVRESVGGLLGSVVYDLDVPDFTKDRLSMSGALLTSSAAGLLPTANPDPEFKTILAGGAPAAQRVFPVDDVLVAVAEIYDNERRTPHRLELQSTVRADDGQVVFRAREERTSDEMMKKGDRGTFGHVVQVPLKGMPPGRYVLRLEATAQLSDRATAAREIEFSIR